MGVYPALRIFPVICPCAALFSAAPKSALQRRLQDADGEASLIGYSQGRWPRPQDVHAVKVRPGFLRKVT
jgi:hypothetical protein